MTQLSDSIRTNIRTELKRKIESSQIQFILIQIGQNIHNEHKNSDLAITISNLSKYK